MSGDARAKVPFAHRRVDRRPSSQVEDVLVPRWMFLTFPACANECDDDSTSEFEVFMERDRGVFIMQETSAITLDVCKSAVGAVYVNNGGRSSGRPISRHRNAFRGAGRLRTERPVAEWRVDKSPSAVKVRTCGPLALVSLCSRWRVHRFRADLLHRYDAHGWRPPPNDGWGQVPSAVLGSPSVAEVGSATRNSCWSRSQICESRLVPTARLRAGRSGWHRVSGWQLNGCCQSQQG